MKKKNIIGIAAGVAVILCAFAFISVSATTDADPLISLSYLEKIILPSFKQEILDELGGGNLSDILGERDNDNSDEQADIDKDTDEQGAEQSDNQSEPDSDETDTVEASASENAPLENVDDKPEASNYNNSYVLLELVAGQTVMAEGICEFISRPGSVVNCISPFEAQGIADITNGNEILNDIEVPINAYCLIPRGNDGRGIKVISEKAYIMIRGDYRIG